MDQRLVMFLSPHSKLAEYEYDVLYYRCISYQRLTVEEPTYMRKCKPLRIFKSDWHLTARLYLASAVTHFITHTTGN